MSCDRNKIMSIAKTEEELCKSIAFPSILKIHRDAIRKRDTLAVVMRQHKKDGEITCILQIEFVNNNHEENEGKSKKKAKKKLQQFTQIDEAILRFLAMKIQIRLERHIAIKEAQKKAQERVEIISMIRGFIRIKTYKAFLIGIKKDLAPFFGYKDIGVLIYDREKDKFFT